MNAIMLPILYRFVRKCISDDIVQLDFCMKRRIRTPTYDSGIEME